MYNDETAGGSRGKLITFEGIDRAGKTSLIQSLQGLLADSRVPITACGEKQSPLGHLLTGESLRDYSGFLKTYLFAADRAWTYEKICLPAVQKGGLVLWDRYVHSAIVYRAVEFHRKEQISDKMNVEFVRVINDPFIRPDLIFYLDISPETSAIRAKKDGATEPYSFDFLASVRAEYLSLVEREGGSFILINGEVAKTEVAKTVASKIREEFRELF
jgi:dTMP kinase